MTFFGQKEKKSAEKIDLIWQATMIGVMFFW